MSYKSGTYLLLLFIALDIVVGTVSDTPPELFYINLFFLFCQIVFIIGIATSIYILMSRTLWFQAGLFGPLFAQFKYAFFAAFAYFVLVLYIRVVRVLDALNGSDIYVIWTENTLYAPLWGIMKFVAVALYFLAVQSAVRLSDAKYYYSRSRHQAASTLGHAPTMMTTTTTTTTATTHNPATKLATHRIV
jgi:hypothetical protein